MIQTSARTKVRALVCSREWDQGGKPLGFIPAEIVEGFEKIVHGSGEKRSVPMGGPAWGRELLLYSQAV